MKIVCAWCNENMGVVLGPADEVSHGACNRGKELVMEDIYAEGNNVVLVDGVGVDSYRGSFVGVL